MNLHDQHHPQTQLAILIFDSKGEVTFITQSAADLLGVSQSTALGRNCRNLLQDPKQQQNLAPICAELAEGEENSHSLILDSPSLGQNVHVNATTIPFKDTHGKHAGNIVFLRKSFPLECSETLFDAFNEGILTVDENWLITSFNKAAETITGWPSPEVMGIPCKNVLHPDICDDLFIPEKNKKGQAQISKTFFITRKDGATTAIAASALLFPAAEQGFAGALLSFHDNTEKTIKNLVINSVSDGVFTIDHNWKISSFNRAAELITGWTKKEVVGKSCSQIFHANVCGEECILGQSIKQRKPISGQTIYIKTKKGETLPLNISAVPYLDPKGKIIGGIETFRDISSSIQNHMILDSIADGVFTVDRNWKITSFNRAAEQITGWTANDAIGNFCSDIFHSSICGKNCAIAQCLYSGKPVANLSINITNTKEEKIPISISASPLIDNDGNIIGGVETFRDLSTLATLRKQLTKNYTFDEIISKSAAMQRIFNILPDIARSPSTVLIMGESGTGKELVARAIYHASLRADQPFIIVNCGALPETLLESELFGYKAGAFTDAKKDKIGRFAAAEKGTLFLDEIGDIPQSLQVKLLRVLQNKVYEPLGSNTPLSADVRIITATNRNLQELVQQGTFREDLFYRLNVVKIQLPPLRERREDIPLLTDHFIKHFSVIQGKDIVGISNAALNILMRYDYPGNIRELENIIEYAFILCDGGFIQPEHLPEPFYTHGAPSPTTTSEPQTAASQTLEEIEKQAIFISLEKNKWRRMDTCRELGISKDTLRRKIERYGLINQSAEEVSD